MKKNYITKIKLNKLINYKATEQYLQNHNLFNSKENFENGKWKKYQVKNLTFDKMFPKILTDIEELDKTKVETAFKNQDHFKSSDSEFYRLKEKLIDHIIISIESDKRAKGLKFNQLLDNKIVDYKTAKNNLFNLLLPFYFINIDINQELKETLKNIVKKELVENIGLRIYFEKLEKDKDIIIKELKAENQKLKKEINDLKLKMKGGK